MGSHKILGQRRSVGLAVQRAVLRTSGGRLRAVWAAAYELVARAVAAYLRVGRSSAAVYLRGSLGAGEPTYGPADIDLVMVARTESPHPGAARRRTHERWRPLAQRLPWIGSLIQLMVYEVDELQQAAGATVLTERAPERLYADEAKLRIRPGLGGVRSDWRRISGPELRPSASAPPRHLAAWLELQWWWRYCFNACLDPERLHVAYLCLKLITQSARVRLRLEQGELVSGHAAVIERALATMPDEQEALRRAMRLRRELPGSPDPPIAEATGFLLRTTALVGGLLAKEAWAREGTTVRLLHADAGELAPTPAAQARLDRLEAKFGPARLLPLADWRARTPHPLWRAGRVDPLVADEALGLFAVDPTDPAALALLAEASGPELRPAVSCDGVLVLPSREYFDGLHRGVQFECSDPVSFALVAGKDSALFPGLGGWSASDCARRGVAAHALWLQRFPRTDPARAGIALGLLLGAARAALFQQSLDRSEPELALTLAATANRLAAEQPGSAGLLEEATAAYWVWREGGPEPDVGGVIALRRLIESLPAYDSSLRPAIRETPAQVAPQ